MLLTWQGPGRLVDALKGPFVKASTPSGHGTSIFALKLWRQDGRAVVVHSAMHDLDDREEVGVLGFSVVEGFPVDEREVGFDDGRLDVASVSRLTVEEPGYGVIACGVVLHPTAGDDVVITAGSFPCSIAVRGIPGLSQEFEPEYPAHRYRREPM